MTPDDILSAKPQQLDIWCAEVMGWKQVRWSNSFVSRMHGIKPPLRGWMPIQSPTSDPAGAWNLMLELIEGGLRSKYGVDVIEIVCRLDAKIFLSVHIRRSSPTDVSSATAYCERHEHSDISIRLRIALARAVCLWAFETGRLPITE